MFACNLGTAVPLCLQIETFKPGLCFKLQEGTEQSKSVVSGLQIIRGQVRCRPRLVSACCSAQPFHRSPHVLVLEPCTLSED